MSAIVLVAAACSSGAGSGGGSDKGHLRISQSVRGPLYVEGSAGYVSVADGSKTVYRGGLAKPATITLNPGSYTVRSYQRICTGNCGHLGSPIDRCSASVDIAANATSVATVELTPTSNSCRIAITS